MRKISIAFIFLLFLMDFHSFAGQAEVEHYALFINGSRCGYAQRSRQVDGSRVINSESIHFEIERMGTPISLDTTETAIETTEGKPLGFRVKQKMAMMEMSEEGEILPDGTMKIESTNAGNRIESTQPYPAGALMSEGLSLLIKKQGLKSGTSFTVDVFSPSMKNALKTSVNIGEKKQTDLLGRVIELIEIKGEYTMPGAGNIGYTEYVDENFKTQKAIIPLAGMNIEMIASSEAFARSELEPAELVENMMLKSPMPITRLNEIKKITYTLVPKSPDMKLDFPSTDSQQVETPGDGSVRLTVNVLKSRTDVGFPYKGNDPAILEALEETPYLQIKHPDIISMAEKCTKGINNAMDAALAVEEFVSGYIENKNLSVGYASALEVLKSRQGDCTEHALLSVALCRAAGIPARVATGLVYAENFIGQMNIFGGHAWTEVYIGGKWTGIDAAMKGSGRGYDAGHITMAVGNGDPSDFFGIAGSQGKFTIKDIEISR